MAYLRDIYNKDFDSLKDGRCCQGVVIYNFPEKKCHGKECILEKKKLRLYPQTETQLDADPLLATYCIQIFVYQQINWRICNRNQEQIMKLKNTITFGVLKNIPGSNPNELMSIILFNY
jgi:hypothetical protein